MSSGHDDDRDDRDDRQEPRQPVSTDRARQRVSLPALLIILNGILQGLSVGIVIVPLAIVTFSDLDPKHRPEATGVFHLLRNVASSLFISICVAEIVRSTGENYARIAEFVNPYNKIFSWGALVGAWDMATVPGVLRLSKEITRQSAMLAYLNTFGWFTVVAAIAMPVSLLIGRPKGPSGQAAPAAIPTPSATAVTSSPSRPGQRFRRRSRRSQVLAATSALRRSTGSK